VLMVSNVALVKSLSRGTSRGSIEAPKIFSGTVVEVTRVRLDSRKGCPYFPSLAGVQIACWESELTKLVFCESGMVGMGMRLSGLPWSWLGRQARIH